jgi:hypothetical protein
MIRVCFTICNPYICSHVSLLERVHLLLVDLQKLTGTFINVRKREATKAQDKLQRSPHTEKQQNRKQ